ncbi:MAG: hypothetical protein LUE98_19415 [Tannerellaceae bacterium]|nr:hypothetical protein [Tannerellaceae bacterium]
MKLKKYISPFHGLLDSFMRYPVVVFVLFYLCFHWSMATLGLVILMLLVQLLIHYIVRFFYDMRSLIQLQQFVRKHDTCTLKKIPVEQLLEEIGLKEETDLLLYRTKDFPYYGDVYQVVDRDARNPILQLTSFTFRHQRSVIIMKDNPEDSSLASRVKLLHEIGHWIYTDYRCWTVKAEAIISFVWINLLALLIVPPLWVQLVFFLVSFFWLMQNQLCEKYYKENRIAESIADAFAFSLLKDHEEIDLYEEYYMRYKTPEEKERMEYFKVWFRDPIDIENDSFFRNMVPPVIRAHILRNNAVNFFASVERLYTPPRLANVWLFVVLGLISYYAVSYPVYPSYMWIVVVSGVIAILLYTYIVIICTKSLSCQLYAHLNQRLVEE